MTRPQQEGRGYNRNKTAARGGESTAGPRLYQGQETTAGARPQQGDKIYSRCEPEARRLVGQPHCWAPAQGLQTFVGAAETRVKGGHIAQGHPGCQHLHPLSPPAPAIIILIKTHASQG